MDQSQSVGRNTQHKPIGTRLKVAQETKHKTNIGEGEEDFLDLPQFPHS